ncbi:uncharacterized protein RHIMIDRAFT_261113 [Rhizopus microsporus ATCC 52813]|uniref:Cas12f1-like TNB domain-containing protein n=1 Tax=Rhizopus microsporus ATCC 52813 TaxID=1340429 RepID=A0A2G4SMB7_RHIZD|nr:uncharacterized protein RHIMIDRAFT_261113 [Rhizopus microsporus ATCC 52813]PHZ09882.1 hypothetical protein RHIMIDRAFT_261113 [Rhizopus microsporus ATCC 52813]
MEQLMLARAGKWRSLLFEDSSKEMIPLVVFGAGMFGKDNVKLKGHRCGVVGKLFKTLKKRGAEDHLIVVTIDEFKISKICSFCSSDDVNIISTSGFKGCSVLTCKQCRKVWQRDMNAAND